VAIANVSIAPSAGEVNRPWAAYERDTRDGNPRRPDVLSKMPRSCKVTFDVLRSFAMGEAVELSIRDLAEMCRLSYAQTRRAIVWRRCGPGRGHRSIFQVRWTLPSFPQRNDPPYARETLRPQRCLNPSFAKAKTTASTKLTPQLKDQTWQPSERAIRWALARARDRLWGLPKPRREWAINALAKAFRWGAAHQPGPWDREQWRRFVFGAIAQFESGPGGLTQTRRRPFGWAMRCAQEAFAELSRREKELRVTEELLARIRREREEAKWAWQKVSSQAVTKPAGASHHSWLGSQGKAGLCGSKAPGATYPDSAGELSSSISGWFRGEADGEANFHHPHNLR